MVAQEGFALVAPLRGMEDTRSLYGMETASFGMDQSDYWGVITTKAGAVVKFDENPKYE